MKERKTFLLGKSSKNVPLTKGKHTFSPKFDICRGNVCCFVHLQQETWLENNVARFAHLPETLLGNNVSWFAHLYTARKHCRLVCAPLENIAFRKQCFLVYSCRKHGLETMFLGFPSLTWSLIYLPPRSSSKNRIPLHKDSDVVLNPNASRATETKPWLWFWNTCMVMPASRIRHGYE